MAIGLSKNARKLWQTMSSIKTGVILLILVVIFAAAGTVVLQRPTADADDIQRAYSPQMLRVLDLLGLTDVFHSWWFVLLLLLGSGWIGLMRAGWGGILIGLLRIQRRPKGQGHECDGCGQGQGEVQ